MKIIYDFGAHNGNDIPYYLTKADKVIAVEANPELAQKIKQKFQNDPRVIVEECALVITRQETVNFYVHKDDTRSGLDPKENLSNYEIKELPTKNVIDLIMEHGKPHFIKIDIEYFDHIILEYLLENNIKPPYISVEAHTIEVFCLLVVLGKYNKFKLIEGAKVPEVYPEFKAHCAGPFGEDIQGEWLTKDDLFKKLTKTGLDWVDIHATYL